jgi:hypothetical protein
MPSEQEALNVLALYAIEQFVAKFTIPIMYGFAVGDAILGTGTLFEIGGRYFIITASHLFDPDDFRRDFREEFNPEKLACPDRRSVSPEHPTTFGNAEIRRSVQTGFDYDVAFLELKNPEKIERLREGWTFLTLQQVGAPTDVDLYFLAGYPVALIERGPDFYSGPLAVVRTNRRPAQPTDARAPVHPNFDLFFNYDTAAKLGTSDKIIEAPRLIRDLLDAYGQPHAGLPLKEKLKLCKKLNPAEISPAAWNVIHAAIDLRNELEHDVNEAEIQAKIHRLRTTYPGSLATVQAKDARKLDDASIAESAYRDCISYLVVATQNKNVSRNSC